MKQVMLPSILALAMVGNTVAQESGFQPLFNGKDMSEFDLVQVDKETFSVSDGTISCTGKPNGYFATKKPYKNYVLKFDFRYPDKPGNSGYLIHIQGPPKVWPACIEVQGMYQNICQIFPIGMKGPRPAYPKDKVAKAVKNHQEWNSVEIIVQDGVITSKLNGVEIVRSPKYDVNEGPIGFQSEGAPIEWRNLRIKLLD